MEGREQNWEAELTRGHQVLVAHNKHRPDQHVQHTSQHCQGHFVHGAATLIVAFVLRQSEFPRLYGRQRQILGS